MHKNTKVTPVCRHEIHRLWQQGVSVTDLSEMYRVSRPVIYVILKRARLKDFSVHRSSNARFRTLFYGFKNLSKIEKKIQNQLERQAHRYEKDYPGEMVHFDTKKLPRIPGEVYWVRREYLFVAIDDYSRHLFADILPNKTMGSAGIFLETCITSVPYLTECAYSDNGTEFKGTECHDFVRVCVWNGIEQKFTRVKRPQTNGKAERVIRTILTEWLRKNTFSSREERRRSLHRYVHFYNTQRFHSALKQGKTPFTPLQIIQNFVNSKTVNNA